MNTNLKRVLTNASAAIAEGAKPTNRKAKDALGIVDPVPEDMWFDPETGFFYVQDDQVFHELNTADPFYGKWLERAAEFPDYRERPFQPAPADGTIPDVVDAEALTATLYDFAHLGPQTEFTDRRRERLREDMESIKADVAKIDAEIAYLNERRTNAMLAYSGISADLTAMDN